MPRRSDCLSLRAAYAELLDLKKRCKIALEEAKRTGNVDPATKLVLLCRQKAKELGQQVSPIWEQVDVTYKMPSYEELKKRFDFVTPILDGRLFEPIFEPIKAYKHISREPRKIRFEYLKIDDDLSTEEVLVEMEKQGIRPALAEELICFAEHYPDEPRKGWIVALGSYAVHDGDRCVAVLDDGGSGKRILLQHGLFDGRWYADGRFLFVRK